MITHMCTCTAPPASYAVQLPCTRCIAPPLQRLETFMHRHEFISKHTNIMATSISYYTPIEHTNQYTGYYVRHLMTAREFEGG